MTEKQRVVCTVIAFVCLPWFPDPLTDIIYRISTTLAVFVVLALISRSKTIKDCSLNIQRLISGLVTSTIVLLVYAVQLRIVLHALAR